MITSIVELLQQQPKERKEQQVLLPALRQKSNEIVQAYGARENFLVTFNPDLQLKVCAHTDICFFGGAPTLGLLNTTYGEQTAAMWLVPQLYNLSEFCGCRDKLTDNQLKECAIVIATEFSYLSVTELMLFFHRFKSGRYGRFYGSVDPLVITTSLRDFLKERSAAYDKHEQEERERQREEEAKRPKETWEDYCMREYGEIRPKPWEQPIGKPKRKPKPQPKENPADIVRLAKSLLNDPMADDNTKAQFGKLFKKKYGMEMKEYIDKYDK